MGVDCHIIINQSIEYVYREMIQVCCVPELATYIADQIVNLLYVPLDLLNKRIKVCSHHFMNVQGRIRRNLRSTGVPLEKSPILPTSAIPLQHRYYNYTLTYAYRNAKAQFRVTQRYHMIKSCNWLILCRVMQLEP